MADRVGAWFFYRKLWDNPIFKKHPNRVAVWVWMLSEAQWSEGKEIILGKEKVILKPGQFTCGSYQISEITGVARGTVERIRRLFKSEEMIEELTDNKKTLITVKKWSEYQKREERNKEQVRNNRGTSEEQVRTTEEGNKVIKKERNKNTTDLAPSGADHADIVSVFDVFAVIGKQRYQDKTQRRAISELIAAYGLEKVLAAAKYAVSVQSELYAPIITNPWQLQKKFSELVVHKSRSNKSQKFQVAEI